MDTELLHVALFTLLIVEVEALLLLRFEEDLAAAALRHGAPFRRGGRGGRIDGGDTSKRYACQKQRAQQRHQKLNHDTSPPVYLFSPGILTQMG